MTTQNAICVVLGANGFVGSHLVDELADAGYTVRAFDQFGAAPQFNARQNVQIVKGNLFDEDDIAALLSGATHVFHSFSLTTPYSSDNDPYTDIEKNLKPSIKIFEACVKAGVKKVAFFSSGGAIYGHLAEEKPATETDAATPVSPYGINKLAIENYLAYFNRKFGMDYVSYRLTNPYGPRQVFRNNQGVIPAFLQQIAENGLLTVLGDGTSTRDYVYIRDVTHMIVNSFARHTKHNVYNIGSGRQTSVNEIIDALKQVIDTKFEVNYKTAPKTFLKNANISVERFSQEFGLNNSMNLQDGLREVVAQQGSTE